jgi:hypothetical protein
MLENDRLLQAYRVKKLLNKDIIYREGIMRILLRSLVLACSFSYASTSLADSVWDKPIALSVNNISAKVYRNASCGCCKKWIAHLEKHQVAVEDVVLNAIQLQAIKTKYSIPSNLQSCHTAKIGSYLVEGHVPMADIVTLLSSKPGALAGISVAAMPAGTPGMEMGARKDPFQVQSFDRSGKIGLFNQYIDY